MKQPKIKRKVALVLIFCCVFFAGCGQAELLDSTEKALVDEQIAQTTELLGDTGDSLVNKFFSFPEMWYSFCVAFKRWAAVIICFSWILGIILYGAFKQSREVQKWVLSVVIIKIPLIVFIMVYVFAFFYGTLCM